MTCFMPNRHAALWLAGAVVLIAFASGCETLCNWPVSVLIARDIESKKPLPGADVQISYPLAESPFAVELSGATAADGIVHLQDQALRRRQRHGGCDVRRLHGRGEGRARRDDSSTKPAHFFEAVERRPVSLVVELYAEPHRDRAGRAGRLPGRGQGGSPDSGQRTCVPGQRLFSGTMSSLGIIQVTGPPLLRLIVSGDFRARFADGSPVSLQPKDREVGLWWISSDSLARHAFFIGTPEEYNSFRLLSRTTGGEEKRSSGGGKSGGPRHGGHRGGSSSSDPSAGSAAA